MKTEWKDVMHLYKGCEIEVRDKDFINGVQYGKLQGYQFDDNLLIDFEQSDGYENIGKCKPILRPLSDMTEEECLYLNVAFMVVEKWAKTAHKETWGTAEFLYLLKQGFDLFGLIESGQALDKTKIV